MNPNLRGMGHTGWDTSNPVHCIRFSWDVGKVAFQYKLKESDATWLPKTSFNESTSTWESGGKVDSYVLITPTGTSKLLSSSPKLIVETPIRSNLQMNILKCASTFEGTVIFVGSDSCL